MCWASLLFPSPLFPDRTIIIYAIVTEKEIQEGKGRSLARALQLVALVLGSNLGLLTLTSTVLASCLSDEPWGMGYTVCCFRGQQHQHLKTLLWNYNSQHAAEPAIILTPSLPKFLIVLCNIIFFSMTKSNLSLG